MKFLFVVVLLVCTNLLFSQRGNATSLRGNAGGRSQFYKPQRKLIMPPSQVGKTIAKLASQQVQWGNGKTAPQQVQWGNGKTAPQQVQWGNGKTAPQVQWGNGKTAPQQVQWGNGKTAPQLSKIEQAQSKMAEIQQQIEQAQSKMAETQQQIEQAQSKMAETQQQNARKPSALLESLDLRDTTYAPDQVILFRSLNPPHTYLAGGMEYRNGQLIVPDPGKYYIYTQIQFPANRPSVLVMVNGHTVTIIQPMVLQKIDMYAAGVFELNAGDIIMLQVSSSGLPTVYMSTFHCYFGAYLI